MGLDEIRTVKMALENEESFGVEFLLTPKEKVVNQIAPIIEGAKKEQLSAIANNIKNCSRCSFCDNKTEEVIDSECELLFISEKPLLKEELDLLTKMIAAMKLDNKISNIALIKCVPNSYDIKKETEICKTFLTQQIEIIKPKIICTLGGTVLATLMNDKNISVSKSHGQEMLLDESIIIPTYSLAYLLRNLEIKKVCWQDLQVIMELLDVS